MDLHLEESYDKVKKARDQEIAYYNKATLVDILVCLEALDFKGYIKMYADAEEYLACEGISRADSVKRYIIKEIELLITKIIEENDLQEVD